MFGQFCKSGVCITAAIALSFMPSVAQATEVIEIVHPENGSGMIVITEGGGVPDSLPILVEVETEGFAEGVEKVEVALDGVIEGGIWTGTSIVDAHEYASEPGDWYAVTDLTEASELTRGDFISEIVIRAFATAAQNYDNNRATTTFDARDSIIFDVSILALEDVDTDGNGMPDADQLSTLSPPGSDIPILIITSNDDGTETYTTFESIAEADLRGSVSLGAELETVIELGSAGSVTAVIDSPTLADLQDAIPGNASLQAATNGILVVSANTNPSNLVSNDINPLSEFDIPDVSAPFGAFVRVYILLEVPAVRGVVPTWVSLSDTLPAGVEVSMELFGTALDGIMESTLYSYNTTFVQEGIDLSYTGDEAGWEAVPGEAINADGNGWEVLLTEVGRIFGAHHVGDDDNHNSSSSATCLIATAAYGTPMAGELNTIRSLRNKYLLNNAGGQMVSEVYYRLSPTMVRVVENNPALMSLTRMVLVPLIAVCGVVLESPVVMLLLAMASMALVMGIRRRKMVHVKS